jgi:hypothetical protein
MMRPPTFLLKEIPGTVPAFFHAQVRIQLQYQTDESVQHQVRTTFLERVTLRARSLLRKLANASMAGGALDGTNSSAIGDS